MRTKLWFVYVIQSFELLHYVGMTRGLKRRLAQHNSGEGGWTRRGTMWKVMHYERFENSIDARNREKYFKNNAGKEWLRRRGII